MIKGRRLLFWSTLITGLFLGLLLFVSVVGYFLLLLPPVQQHVLRVSEDQLNGYFKGEISIERIETDLLSRVELHGVRAHGKDFSDSITVGKISVRYSLAALLRKTVRVRSFEVRDISANVLMNNEGIVLPFLPLQTETKHPSEPDTSKSDWKFILGTGRIVNLNAVYRDSSLEMLAEIRDAEAMVEFHQVDSFSVNLNVPSARFLSPWWSGTIDRIDCAALLTFNYIDVESLQISGSGSNVRGNGKITYSTEEDWDLYAEFASTLKPLPVLFSTLPELADTGYVQGEASWVGSFDNPVLNARLEAHELTYESYTLDSLLVRAVYGLDEKLKGTVRSKSKIGLITINGGLELKSLMSKPDFGKYWLTGLADRVNVNKLLNKWNITNEFLDETAQLNFDIQGSGIESFPEIIELEATVDSGFLDKHPLKVSANLNGKRWQLKTNWGENVLRGIGSLLDSDSLVVKGLFTADLNQPSLLSKYLINEAVYGNVFSRISLNGTLLNPEIDAFIKGDDISWRSSNLESVSASLSANGFDINSVYIGNASISGDISIDSLLPFLRIEHDIGGTVQVKGSVQGELYDPDMNMFINAKDFFFGDYAIQSLEAQVTAKGTDTLFLHNLLMQDNGVTVSGKGKVFLHPYLMSSIDAVVTGSKSGEYGNKGEISLNLSVPNDSLYINYSVSEIDMELLRPWLPVDLDLSAIIHSEGKIEGVMENPSMVLGVKASELVYDGNRLVDAELRAELHDSLLTVDSWISFFPAMEMNVSGEIPLKPGSGWKVDESEERNAWIVAKGDSLDMSAFELLFGDDFQVYGPTNFSLDAQFIDKSWNLAGDIFVSGGELKYLPENIHASEINVAAKLGGTIHKPLLSFDLNAGSLVTPWGQAEGILLRGITDHETVHVDSASISIVEDGHIDIRVKIPFSTFDSPLTSDGISGDFRVDQFPISFLSSLLPDYDLKQGVVNANGTFVTEGRRPLLNGDVIVENGEFSIPDIHPSIGSVNARIALNGDLVQLERLRARWGDGRVRGRGDISWNLGGVSSVDLNLRGTNLNLDLPDVVQLGIESANMNINSRNGNYVVGGRLSLGQTRYMRDVRISDVVEQIQIGQSLQRDPDPFLEKVILRVDIDLANNLQIDMNLGNIDIDGRVSVGGTVAEPAVSGELTVTNGYVLYLDRRFDITEGTIYNPDPFELNPNLNLRAEADVIAVSPNSPGGDPYLITMTLTGTLESPVFRFSSEPELNELDIISVLTLGQTFGSVGSDLGERLRSFATQQVAGFGARKLEQLLGLDRIDITGDIFGGNGDQSARVSITKRLSSRLIVTYETMVENLRDNKTTAHYRLTPNLYLEGQATSEGNSGLDLIFRFSR
ncbi:translocation/assembly module TamB [Chitinispirillales bacterium ANBcel5]|uniref:translocation/assembly module TamB domain-containing protein n=1 Tax=Cellulosispirillum alkaliphilum TaxID=3039283 RepID=UPI002A4EE160|nr:translocation/assembly module TamB [Chitinispirillales bacterium ANBcel5]